MYWWGLLTGLGIAAVAAGGLYAYAIITLFVKAGHEGEKTAE